jgi:hypothetical protein
MLFKIFIQWLKGHDITYVIDGFKYLCGLPLIVGAIKVA